MQNLDAYFKDKGFLEGTEGRALLEAYADEHMVKLRISERYPHLGILHYRDDIVFGKGNWNDFAKACRGVILDFTNKKIVTRPFKKFFNVGEVHAPSLRELEAMKGNWVMEKLDGSMIQTIHDSVTGHFIASTKGSIDSEQGKWATSRIPESVKNPKLLNEYTLMWEMISKEHQIVIPYEKKGYEEGLYLIGVRHNMSEKLFTPPEVQDIAKEYNLKTFRLYEFPSIEAIIDHSKDLPFMEEGYVIRFQDDELMVKVKGKDYLRIHRFIGNLSEGNLLDILIEGKQEEVYANIGFVPEEYREDVERTLKNYQREALDFRADCYTLFASFPKGTRKDFALAVKAAKIGEKEGFVFKLMDGKDPKLTDIYSTFRKRRKVLDPAIEAMI